MSVLVFEYLRSAREFTELCELIYSTLVTNIYLRCVVIIMIMESKRNYDFLLKLFRYVEL